MWAGLVRPIAGKTGRRGADNMCDEKLVNFVEIEINHASDDADQLSSRQKITNLTHTHKTIYLHTVIPKGVHNILAKEASIHTIVLKIDLDD